jgi:type IV pilus assembly protein PilX
MKANSCIKCHRRQRGVTMLFGLIVLAIMMIGAAAMIRSMNTSLFNAGNLGFKRDLTNQAERASNAVMTALNTGALAGEAARQQPQVADNYSATMLPVNAQGIPNALLSDGPFAAVGVATRDIDVPDQGVRVRYVVDRLCINTGIADSSHCTMADRGTPDSRDSSDLSGAGDTSSSGSGAVPRVVVYRLSIRVTGPRNTQAYFQTTLTL